MQEIIINLDNIPEEEYREYRTREAARGIIFNKDNKIAAIYVGAYDYYKTVGGGLEHEQSQEEALNAECKEEIACTIKNIEQLPIKVIEIRGKTKLLQTNSIFKCQVNEIFEERNLTDAEGKLSYETKWLENEDCYQAFMTKAPSGGNESAYIWERGKAIIQACRDLGVL